MRELESNLEQKCAFCRHPIPETEEESDTNHAKRTLASDPEAMCRMGGMCLREGNCKSAFFLLSKAATSGNITAHYNLGLMYQSGQLGVEKDEEKMIYHWEKAAIGGDPYARHNLGQYENGRGMHERAVRHWIIAANLGCVGSLVSLRLFYREGLVSKEAFAAALRAHQAAIDATKSPQREAATKLKRDGIWSLRV